MVVVAADLLTCKYTRARPYNHVVYRRLLPLLVEVWLIIMWHKYQRLLASVIVTILLSQLIAWNVYHIIIRYST